MVYIPLLIIIFFLAYREFKRKNTGRTIYRFNIDKAGLSPDIPYITIDVQGNKLNMIVDSGCGVSIITKKTLNKLNYKKCDRLVSLSAITEDSLNANMVTIPIKVNGKIVEEDFSIYDVDDFANFNKSYGINIDGLLGNEFLEKANAVIDYENYIISFL